MIAQPARLRRDRASSGQFGDTPAQAQLRQQRVEAAARVKSLAARCRETDPQHARALVVLTDALRDAEHQLAALDAALARPSAEIVALPTPDEGEPTAAEARDAARRRLHLLLVVLATVPDSCAVAARTLRRGIKRELAQLESLRGIEPRRGT